MLDILRVGGWDDVSRIAAEVAWVGVVRETGHVVVVGRHQVEGVECGVGPMARHFGTRDIVVVRQVGMANGSRWGRRHEPP